MQGDFCEECVVYYSGDDSGYCVVCLWFCWNVYKLICNIVWEGKMLNYKCSVLSIVLVVVLVLILVLVQFMQNIIILVGIVVINFDMVQVIGICRGIESVIVVKQDVILVVEVIFVEDIGKLFDVSIVEFILCLFGFVVQCVVGCVQVISVCGLLLDFVIILFNGCEVVSIGDNRGVEFDQYLFELVNGVIVYKILDVVLVGQGLLGIIDMQIVCLFSFGECVIVVSGCYQKSLLGCVVNIDLYGNCFSVSYIDQFLDKILGIVIGYVYSDMLIQENQVGLYELWIIEYIDKGDCLGVGVGIYFFDGIKVLCCIGNNKCDGVMVMIQFWFNNSWISIFDVFYIEVEQIDIVNQFELNFSNYNGNYILGLLVSNLQVNVNGLFIGGIVSGVYLLVCGMYNKCKDKIDVFGWNNEFNFSGVKLVVDLNYFKVMCDELNLENNLQLILMLQLDMVGVLICQDGFLQISLGLNYFNFDVLFLINIIYGFGYGKVLQVEDCLKGGKLVVIIVLFDVVVLWVLDIDIGVNYVDCCKVKIQFEGNILLGVQGDVNIVLDLQYCLVNLGFVGFGIILVWNVFVVVGCYMIFNLVDNLDYLIFKLWMVQEKIIIVWVCLNINVDIGEVGVCGNIGVQMQYIDQSLDLWYWDSLQLVGNNVQLYFNGCIYNDWLLSLNLVFLFLYQQMLCFVVVKQVVWLCVDQMCVGLEFGVDIGIGCFGGSGGNLLLDLWCVIVLDLFYEKYFGEKVYVVVVIFYKDLKSYVYIQLVDNYDFIVLLGSYVLLLGMMVLVLIIGIFFVLQNGKGGMLKGLELIVLFLLEMLIDSLCGFGVQVSVIFNKSDIIILDLESVFSVGSDLISLFGLFKCVYNFMVYYECSGFEVCVSQCWCLDFIGEIGNFNGNCSLCYVVGENVIDVQISYIFSDSSILCGFILLLQGSNLINELYCIYVGSKDCLLEYIEWGCIYMLGVNYKF